MSYDQQLADAERVIGVAHIICNEAGIPPGEIIGRLTALSLKATSAAPASQIAGSVRDDPEFKRLLNDCTQYYDSEAEGEFLALVAYIDSLRAPRSADLADIERLLATVKYMIGIAERGTGQKMPDYVTAEQFVLSYVQGLEASQFKFENCTVSLSSLAGGAAPDGFMSFCSLLVEKQDGTCEVVDYVLARSASVQGADELPTPREMAIAQAMRQACVNAYSPDSSAHDWSEAMADIRLTDVIRAVTPVPAPLAGQSERLAALEEARALCIEMAEGTNGGYRNACHGCAAAIQNRKYEVAPQGAETNNQGGEPA